MEKQRDFVGNKLTQFLSTAHPLVFNSYTIIAAFGTYFCMYAFRKPYTAAAFADAEPIFEVNYKIILVIAQLIGYTSSKFIGIKFISEMGAGKRALAILGFIGFAEVSLFLFAEVPAPYNIFFLFCNGLPLGMIWGLVFGFLEGRRTSEVLGAGLSASYILASGVVKSVGAYIIKEFGISDYYMPFITGLVFTPALLLFVYMLKNLPPPSAEDEATRVKREPMDANDRKEFFFMFAPGLTALVGLYMLLTAFRDFRDNFAKEIWVAMGAGDDPSVFTKSESWVTAAVLIVLALVMVIRSNKKAMLFIHYLMIIGSLMIGLSAYLYESQLITPLPFMIMTGIGLYVGYVPFGCILFDRLIASAGVMATAGFLIYLSDAFGYLGSVGLNLYKNFGEAELPWLDFFLGLCYITAGVCTAAFVFSLWYFSRHEHIGDDMVKHQMHASEIHDLEVQEQEPS